MWHGYCVLTVDNTQPQSLVSTCLGVVGMAGVSPTTNKAHEKSVVKVSKDASKYIWEVTKADDTLPTLDYVKNGILTHTPLVQAQVDALILNVQVFAGSGIEERLTSCRNYISNNITDWEVIE